jgi:hypothetical protein
MKSFENFSAPSIPEQEGREDKLQEGQLHRLWLILFKPAVPAPSLCRACHLVVVSAVPMPWRHRSVVAPSHPPCRCPGIVPASSRRRNCPFDVPASSRSCRVIASGILMSRCRCVRRSSLVSSQSRPVTVVSAVPGVVPEPSRYRRVRRALSCLLRPLVTSVILVMSPSSSSRYLFVRRFRHLLAFSSSVRHCGSSFGCRSWKEVGKARKKISVGRLLLSVDLILILRSFVSTPKLLIGRQPDSHVTATPFSGDAGINQG